MTENLELDWRGWMDRWDRQQEMHFPFREFRFSLVADALATLLPSSIRIIDIGAGPGSLSSFVLDRIPRAEIFALDSDPVMLAMGEAVLGDKEGRLKWVNSDLRSVSWASRPEFSVVDAVITSAALHWLPMESLVQVFENIGRIVRPGGLFINSDHIRFSSALELVNYFADETSDRRLSACTSQHNVDSWDEWWADLAAIPGMDKMMSERARSLRWFSSDTPIPSYELHESALKEVGFREVATIWQYVDERVVLAVR